MARTRFEPVAAVIPWGDVVLEGVLEMPDDPAGVVLLVPGREGTRHDPTSIQLAGGLREAGFGTLQLDLLAPGEPALDPEIKQLAYQLELLASRLLAAVTWLRGRDETQALPRGFFGGNTGAAVALVAAAEEGSAVRAIVTRAGRPDLAGTALLHVTTPTLFIAGSEDEALLAANQAAFSRIAGRKSLEIVLGSGAAFDEPGVDQLLIDSAATWFHAHLKGQW